MGGVLIIGVIKGDTRSYDYSSYGIPCSVRASPPRAVRMQDYCSDHEKRHS